MRVRRLTAQLVRSLVSCSSGGVGVGCKAFMSHRATSSDKGTAHPLSGVARSVPKKGTKFYAVANGRERGIYSTWQQCSSHVTGYPGAHFQSFTTLQAARDFLQQHPIAGLSSSTDEHDSSVQNGNVKKCTRCAEGEAAHVPRMDKAASISDVIDVDCHDVKRRKMDSSCEVMSQCRQASYMSPSSSPHVLPVTNTSTEVQEVYVDGACRHNGKSGAHGGYGGFYGSHTDGRNFALPLLKSEPQTNNRAELHAVLRAIQQGFVDAGAKDCFDLTTVPALHCLTRPLYKLRIFTDSRYVVEGWRRYSARWLRNGFRLANGTAVLNQDLWRHLLALRQAYNTIYTHQHTHSNASSVKSDREEEEEKDDGVVVGVEIFHVRGHANVFGNVVADQLAVEGAMKATQEENTVTMI